jgi:tetratricopeptide (TPR) repeat protein
MTNETLHTKTARIFISYARKDGEKFADNLLARLGQEFEKDQLKKDRLFMEGGRDWWNQITGILDVVKFMVLVATPASMQSTNVRREWRYARQKGVCVYPVQVPGSPIDFDKLPRWMRDSHFYDLDKEWETFVNYLKNPCNAMKVPFMVEDMPDHFVRRPKEFDALIEQLLDEPRDNPVAITTSLIGTGGFGKTTLATALCHNDDVLTAFDDGILWVTLGKNPNLVNALTKLYAALTGERTGFIDVENATRELADRLADLDCLIVIDDVWNPAHLRPFLRGGERCARLITTQRVDVATDANAIINYLSEMTSDESTEMLAAGIDPIPTDLTPFQTLASRLGGWPLMLEIANGMIQERLALGDTLEPAVQWVNQTLDNRGIMGIKRDDIEERKQSAAGVLGASIELLSDDEQTRLYQLAIFGEDHDIPLPSIKALWGLNYFDTEDSLIKIVRLSLIRFDLEQATVRLHDVIRTYLREQNQKSIVEWNNRFLGEYHLEYWHEMPQDEPYLWDYLAYHLLEAGRINELVTLLTSTPEWMDAKLANGTARTSFLSDLQYAISSFSDPLDVSELLVLIQLYMVKWVFLQRTDTITDDELQSLVRQNRVDEAMRFASGRSSIENRFVGMFAIRKTLDETQQSDNLPLEKLSEFAQDIRVVKLRAKAWCDMARYFYDTIPDSAVDSILKNAVEAIQDIPSIYDRAEALCYLATAFAKTHRQSDALDILQQAQNIQLPPENDYARIDHYHRLSHLMIELDQRDRATQMLEKAVGLAASSEENWKNEVLSRLVLVLGRLDLFQKIIDAVNAIPDQYWKVHALSGLAADLAKREHKSTISYFQMATQIADEITDPRSRNPALQVLAANLAKARRLDDAIHVSNSINIAHWRRIALQAINTAYSEMGQIHEGVQAALRTLNEQDQASLTRSMRDNRLTTTAQLFISCRRFPKAIDICRKIEDPSTRISLFADISLQLLVNEQREEGLKLLS